MQTSEIPGRDHHPRRGLPRPRFAGFLKALLRVRLPEQASRLMAHFEARGIAVDGVQSIATSIDGAIRVLEMELADGTAPIVFLLCATPAETARVFAEMQAKESADLFYRNGNLIMFLWRWSEAAAQLEPVVAAFASFRHRSPVAILAQTLSS